MTDEHDPYDDDGAHGPQPPHDLAAERALLGACLNSPRALDESIEAVAVADFYRPVHGRLFQAMIDMRARGREVDAVTLADWLGTEIVALGGAPYLHDLLAAVITSTNVGYYAEIIVGQSIRRQLMAAGQRAIQLAHSTAGDAGELVERARSQLDQVAASTRAGTQVHELDTLMTDALHRYTSPAPPSLPTGWADLDRMLAGGLRPGALTVIGARPGVGKSMLGANLATSVAEHGVGTLVVSLEMTRAELTDRVIADVSGVDLGRITRVKLDDRDWRAVQGAAERVRAWPLSVVDDPYLSLTGIRSLARDRARTRRGLGLVVVDYLQLISPADTKIPREQQIAALSRGLKLLAKELNVPVVALAQLNRGSATRPGKDRRPLMSDLRESGAIEADADGVWLLHYDDDQTKSHEIEVIIAKNRGGRTGSVHLAWMPHLARVGSQARLEAI